MEYNLYISDSEALFRYKNYFIFYNKIQHEIIFNQILHITRQLFGTMVGEFGSSNNLKQITKS